MNFADRISTGKQSRPMRNLFYGVEGVGKSTFASLFPDPITLAAENGTDSIDTSRFVPKNFTESIEFLRYLYEEDHSYKTINIDTIGWLEAMAAKALVEEDQVATLEDYGGGYGKYKRALNERFDIVLQWCAALYGQKNMHINLLGHTEIKKYSNPNGEDYDRFNVACISRDVAERCKQWSDNVFFMNFDERPVEDDPKNKGFGKKAKAKSFGHRLIKSRRSAAYDAKTRMDFPDELMFVSPPKEGFEDFWSYYDAWLADSSTVTPETETK